MNPPGPTTRFEFFADPEYDPSTHGWYIVSVDADGEVYDTVGAYDSEAEARAVAAQYNLE